MKQVLMLFVVVAAAAGGWLGRGLLSSPGEEIASGAETDDESPAIEVSHGVVKLDEATAGRLGIVASATKAATWINGVEAIGVVLDPAPLIVLNEEIEAATVALQASQVELDRAQSLFQGGENVARKSVDSAQAIVRADTLRLEALRVRLPLEWGQMFAGMDDAARGGLAEKLATRKDALVRVEAMGGREVPHKVTGAEVSAFGSAIKVEHLAAAPAVNERTQAIAYLLLCDASGQTLPNGTSVSARLLGPDAPRKGVAVPRDAVVRQGPQAWVYLEQGPREFIRVPVPLGDRTVEGWFVADGGFLAANAKLVTTGAAALLSAELTSAGFGGGEE